MKPVSREEHAVSPVIGVMLMIVVTIIIAAVVSAFAGGYANSDRKAPIAVISAEVLPWHTEWPTDDSLGNSTGILFTEKSGDFIDLDNVWVVLTCGDESVHFMGNDMTPRETPSGWKHPAIFKVIPFTAANGGFIFGRDSQITPGNQFLLYADNNGSGNGVLGWMRPEDSSQYFYLAETEICTYQIVDVPSQQTISGGRINL
ncbi:MAG: type IV pilin N-terminal domain-containing protein [Methanoregula sp.]|jgi:hypothetical protein